MFKILRTFESVYRTRSFTKSAEELFFSQSTVSKHVQWLEATVDKELFIRQGSNELLTTQAGETVYEAATEIIRYWDETLELVRSQETNAPHYVIGSSHTFSALYLPALIQHLHEINGPNIQLDLRVMNSSEVMIALEKGDIHLGFVEMPVRRETVDIHHLIRDELVLAGNLDSDLWLLRESSSAVRQYTEDYLQTHSIHERSMIVDSNMALIRMLELGLGKSLISSKLVGDMDFLPLASHYIRFFCLVDRANDYHSQSLVKQTIQYFEELQQ